MSNHYAYEERKYEFGKCMLHLRTQIGLTQIALAKHVGVHRRSVQNWETGVSYPKPEMLRHLVTMFLKLGAFSTGREYQEAHALWDRAARDGPYQLPSFDEVWFARISALHAKGSFLPFQHDQPMIEVLDRIIGAVSDEYVLLPSHLQHKISHLVQVFGESAKRGSLRSAKE